MLDFTNCGLRCGTDTSFLFYFPLLSDAVLWDVMVYNGAGKLFRRTRNAARTWICGDLFG